MQTPVETEPRTDSGEDGLGASSAGQNQTPDAALPERFPVTSATAVAQRAAKVA